MLQREVHFNVNELARCAADAIGADSCIQITKQSEDMYNKSMLLTMNDGAQVVAKIPNPNAGLSHLTTASEVATMDFVSQYLHVYALCYHMLTELRLAIPFEP